MSIKWLRPSGGPRVALALWLACILVPLAGAQTGELRVGHWVVAKGEMGASDFLMVSELELAEAEDEEVLVGTVTRVADSGKWFELLGQRVHVSDKTTFRKVEIEQLAGARVKVEGYYRGPRKFSARTVALRGDGRDQIAGRVDAVRPGNGGLELDVMRFALFVPDSVELIVEGRPSDFDLIDARGPSRQAMLPSIEGTRERDDDDYIPGRFRLTDDLVLGLLLEVNSTTEDEFDLDKDTKGDRVDTEASLRAELTWRPHDDFYVLGGIRQTIRWRDDEADGSDELTRLPLVELYGYWSDVLGAPVDLQVGLQDFDEEREWLWDENLDAVRTIWKFGDARLELAAATTLHDGSPRDEATDVFLAYLYHEVDSRLWGAYVIDSRTNLNGVDDYPIHFGGRLLGEWLPNNDVWAELAIVRGYTDDVDIRGWGYDLGTTWTPDFADPWYLNVGYAFGSGDDDGSDGVDHAFRQTGYQDNNDKLGGVTSFKYYGELFEPELANLGIVTLGVGRRIAERHSIDLVYHEYRQDEERNRLRDSQLDMRPSGQSADLGRELDLVYGSRLQSGFDVEVVLGAFEPGDAFPGADTAYLAKVQLRMRF